MILLGFALVLLQTDASTERTVTTTAELVAALRDAAPGARILVAPGDYDGFQVADVVGTAQRPIVVRAAEATQPPVFRGGIQLSDVAHVVIAGLVIAGAPHNGLNVDDGGTFDTPSHHVRIRDVVVRDCGGRGNEDGIKLSGVDDFTLERCTVERWGRAGSAVDMVGCHRGRLEDCTFRDQATDAAATGVQMKGGTRDVEVRGCLFEHAGDRAVHIGGSTSLAYFRPRPEGFEARNIVVHGCTFVGSEAPVAFVGVDGALVQFNTFYEPRKWCLRILQETRADGFVPCRRGVFADNIVVFDSSAMRSAVNVGPGTEPDTFRFERNWWWCRDDPARSRPQLPVAEKDPAGGADPLFVDAKSGDLRLVESSPARRHGAGALAGESRR